MYLMIPTEVNIHGSFMDTMTCSSTSVPTVCTAYVGGGGYLKTQVLQRAFLSSKCITMVLFVLCFVWSSYTSYTSRGSRKAGERKGTVIFSFTFVTKNYRVEMHLCKAGLWSFIKPASFFRSTLSYHGQNEDFKGQNSQCQVQNMKWTI